METTSAVVELFFVAVLLTLFFATVDKSVKTKIKIKQRILIVSLALSLVTDALMLLLDGNNPVLVQGKVLFAISILALYVSFADFFSFTLSVVEIKRKSSKTVKFLPIVYGVIFAVFTVIFVATNFSFLFGEKNSVLCGYFIKGFCFFPILLSLAVLLSNVKNLDKRDAVALTLSCVFPIIAFPFEVMFELPFIRTSAVVSVLIAEATLLHKERYLYVAKSRELAEKQLELNESQTRVMISQIQPHFLYNALATIGYICQKDAQTASKAIDAFAEYLRMNLTAITSDKTVPFNQELEHIKTYLWLEKMRFEERLNIVYNIDATNFNLPALSVQPLVENAVKHGLCEKENGGTLTLRSVEYGDAFVIMIEDDGVGFDAENYAKDGKMHVGIENVKSRLSSMCNATLTIKSEKNKGTTAIIRLPKENV